MPTHRLIKAQRAELAWYIQVTGPRCWPSINQGMFESDHHSRTCRVLVREGYAYLGPMNRYGMRRINVTKKGREALLV